MTTKRDMKVVVDCDAGLDDAWALLLLSANLSQILGVTCVNGNTDLDNVSHNVRYLFAVAKAQQIPVYGGAKTPLVTSDPYECPPDFLHFHGRNGFGDVPLPPISPEEDFPQLQTENAVVALNRLAAEYKGELTVVCLGPLTNIALAIRTYPEFVDNVKEFFIMGGNYTGAGNISMCAEFNFHCDPEAAHAVFSAACEKITLLPWETCLATKIPYDWRTSLTAETGNPALKLMDRIEASVLERAKRIGLVNWINCDQLLASIVLDPGVVLEATDHYATVELTGRHTRGQVVIDHLLNKRPNVTIVKRVDVEKHKAHLWELRHYPC